MLEASSQRPTDGYGRSGTSNTIDQNYPASSHYPSSSRTSARPSSSARPSESRSHRPSTMGESSSRRSTNAHPSIHETRSGGSRMGGEVVVYDDEKKGKSSRRESIKGMFSRR